MHGLTYSRFMFGMKCAGIAMDRKVLAEIAAREPETFKTLAEKAAAAIKSAA